MNTERRTDPFRVRRPQRLSQRLSRALVASSGLALLLAGLIFDGYVYFSQRAALVDDMRVQARIIAENTSAAILFEDTRAAAQTLAGLQASASVLRAELLDAKGRIVASYSVSDNPALPPDVRQQLAPSQPHDFVDGRLLLRQVIREGRRDVGNLYLVVDLAPLHRRVLMHVGITILASAAAFALAYVMVLRIRRDIDATEGRLDYLAYYDPVTGLPNRHAANEQMSRLIGTVGRSSDGFALLLLDLDDFKIVNDTLGHAVGDELLRAIAQRLTQHMRPADIACRFGGDEFVILSPRVAGRVHIEVLAVAAMKALAEPVNIGGHEVRISGSIGLAHFPTDANDIAGLLRAADTAMYDAKGKGKNTYSVYDGGMEQGALAQLRLDNDLRRAIERNELRLAYQPIVNLGSHRVEGAEALLRWDHPELGAVPPAEFIPLAERSGLIVEIGQWVLNQACLQIKAWAEAGHTGIFVAVNVSARQIRRGLRAQVDTALALSGADPRMLEIEITEHSMVEDIASNVDQIAALGEMGIRVAVDDFGTGLSSLAYLKRLPINKLKIDRAFVKDLPHSRDDATIALAIISMAHSLELTVVAEGVETREQQDMLAAQGCDAAQGYLYSKPVAASEIGRLLAQETAAVS
ncbi:putative bifunctional diguanylate cyclase/phosphodiesterase [Piscinibacter terrae]|uniref:EAL domain-containing protein n=1 Tax=Piscinibacter terrae TaxID=2496871 RepID=A0A3N7HLT6_9BURK|nr:EAL domain-containing protein [Albitalea terrae]RQP23080.1 EAL domain-containing protein [Albitalea terrae]